MKGTSGFLYVARYKWPLRLIAIGLALLLALLRPSVPEIWRSSGWFFGGGLIFLYGLAAAFLLEVFVRRTWLTNRGIFQRSMFGKTKIQELLIQRDEALIVNCQGEQPLKVHAMEGNAEAIIEAMKPFLASEIHVVTI